MNRKNLSIISLILHGVLLLAGGISVNQSHVLIDAGLTNSQPQETKKEVVEIQDLQWNEPLIEGNQIKFTAEEFITTRDAVFSLQINYLLILVILTSAAVHIFAFTKLKDSNKSG